MVVELITPNILEKKVRLKAPPSLEKRDTKLTPRKYDKLKHPKDSNWNLPDIRESLWETVPIEDELFKHAHYMDRNRSYR